jgi:hypothetical protein
MFTLRKKPVMRLDRRLRTLRNSAVLSLIICSFSAVTWAAPSAKPAASTAPATPAAAGKKADAAKAAPAAASKAASPAPAKAEAKPAKPEAKPSKPEAKATKPEAKAEAKVQPKAEAKAQPKAEAKAQPKAEAKAQPKPVVFAAAPRPAAPAPALAPAASKDEISALRAEVKALREDLTRAVGTPVPTASPERGRLEAELSEEHKKLAAIQAAVDGGLDRAAVADSITRSEARSAELEADLAKLPAAEAPPPPSLYEVSAEVARLHAVAPPVAAAAQPAQAANVVAAAAVSKPLIDSTSPERRDMMEKLGLLPLEFTAFGDFFYRFERPGSDDFHVGAVELDASLKLTPYVNVSTAVVYDGAEDAFGLGAFVIDCGIAGDGDGYVLQSKLVSKSGVSFGRFDVPFGIAYLQYPSVENRLLTLPQAVELTHGGWSDMGAQGYAVGEHWTAVGYVVNGPEHPVSAQAALPSRTATGARLSAKADELLEVGGSGALDFAAEGPVMAFVGGDLATTLGPLDVRGEYLLKHVKVPGIPELTHGVYGQALLRVDPAFLVARYDTVLEGSKTLDRRIVGGAGVSVFEQGEIRAVYEQSLDSDIRMMTLQLVGGSSFQPTGLRR